MRTEVTLVSIAVFVLAVACGDKEPARSPVTPAASSGPSASGPSVEPERAAEPAPEPRRRKPFEVYSACTEVVTVAFGEDPKASAAGKRTLAPSASIEGPRDSDGNQTVWLLDTNGEPLVKVHVTRGMKRVEIGRSCRTLDAR
jgi:hypothetical protein